MLHSFPFFLVLFIFFHCVLSFWLAIYLRSWLILPVGRRDARSLSAVHEVSVPRWTRRRFRLVFARGDQSGRSCAVAATRRTHYLNFPLTRVTSVPRDGRFDNFPTNDHVERCLRFARPVFQSTVGVAAREKKFPRPCVVSAFIFRSRFDLN